MYRPIIWSSPTPEQLMEMEIFNMLRTMQDMDELAWYWGKDGLMIVCAVRYCLGRQTYIVSDCVTWLLEMWPKLPESTQKLLQKDIEDAFERDDKDRAENKDRLYLGMNMDRAEWAKVRLLWRH